MAATPPGVYLTVTGKPTTDQRHMAALLYAGRGSILTGRAALHFTPRQIRFEQVTVVTTIKAALGNVRAQPAGVRTLAALRMAS